MQSPDATGAPEFNSFFSKEKHRDCQYIKIFFVSLLIASAMSAFCVLTPWVYDDFSFGSGESTPQGILAAQIREYMTWSGKFVGHFMSRVLLHGPAWLHPALTPIVFMGLIFSGVLLVLGAQWREKIRAWHVATVAGLTWLALPAFGTVFFWRTGTPDYGYSLAFATAFLTPFRFWADKKDYRVSGGPAYALVGFLAGCSNENVGMLAILAATCVTVRRMRGAARLPIWAASGIVGAMAGWTTMMTAPGNTVRLAQIGGAEKIPLLSMQAFQKFLAFWSSQQLELLPFFLIAAAAAWRLRRHGGLTSSVWGPGIAFFLMSQASLAAFLLSPSTPYRAMSATFFYAVLCCFSFLAAPGPSNAKSKILYAAFCVIVLGSVITQLRVFLLAQPAIHARNHAVSQGAATIASYAYPQTNKFFFPGYDIREIDLYGTDWRRMAPWNDSTPLTVAEGMEIRALVVCNIVYLENLPAGKVHAAAIAPRMTVSSALQTALRTVAPLTDDETSAAAKVRMRYAPASATVTDDGKAAMHIPGVRTVDDIAYLAFEKTGEVLLWRRATAGNQ